MKRLGQDLGIRFLRFMIIERNRGEVGNKYHFRIWRLNADSACELQSVHSGHDNIGDQQIKLAVLNMRQGLKAIAD